MARSGQSTDYDLLVPVAFLGDSGVGKTCLILRGTGDFFSTSYGPRGLDFQIKTYTDIDGAQDKRIKVQFMDVKPDRYEGRLSKASLVFLVYDVTDEQSFLNIKNHLKELHTVGMPGCNLVLLGNKCDDTVYKLVEDTRGQALAQEISQQMGREVPFFEVSAKNANLNVTEAFKKGIADTYRRLNPPQQPQLQRDVPVPVPAAPPPPWTSFLTSLKNFFRAAGRFFAAAGRGIGSVIAWPFRMAARGISWYFSSSRSSGGQAVSRLRGPGHTTTIIQSQGQAYEPPDEFLCPVLRTLMKDPVLTEAGQTYERSAIETWLATHSTDPLNPNQRCNLTQLRPNHALRSMITAWKGQHPLYSDGSSQEEKKSVSGSVPGSVQAPVRPASTASSTTKNQAQAPSGTPNPRGVRHR